MKLTIDIGNLIFEQRKIIIDYLINSQDEFKRKYNLISSFTIYFIKNISKVKLEDKIWKKLQSIIFLLNKKITFYQNLKNCFKGNR